MAPGLDKNRAFLEFSAVLLTGVTFLVFENVLGLKLPFIIACSVVWGAYLLRRAIREPSVFREWGIRTDNLRKASLLAGGFLLLGAAAMLSYRLLLGWRPLPATALLIFAIYPVWSFIQQFLVQSLVTRNLRELGLPARAIIPISAVVFGLCHLPDWPLVGLCVVAGAFWAAIYLAVPNLLPLAVTHGWLGAITYYCVLLRDPWAELFG